MVFSKKAATPATQYDVPSLEDASPEYAELLKRQRELHAEQATLGFERKELEKKIRTAPKREYTASVAEILGEDVNDENLPRKRLAEVVARDRDLTTAIEVLRQRLRVARTAASQAVIASVKPEYIRIVGEMGKAMQALDAVHREYVNMVDQFVAEDVAWTGLGVMTPHFLGSAREPERPIARWLRDAKEAGYAN
jgi:hypothetical protein